MPRVIGIVQARLSSRRLPAKILAPIFDRPLLAVLLERLRGARVDEWWVATSSRPEDCVTEVWARELGCRVHRGPLDDVLARFTAIIREREPDWVVRVTADNPFVDGEIVNRLIEEIPGLDPEATVVGADASDRTWPLGYVPQLARADAVLCAEREIPPDQPFHRAHVLTWLGATGGHRHLRPPPGTPRRGGWRWTVDTLLDLEMARHAFAVFGDRWREIGYADMVAALDRHPEIPRINRQVRQKSPEEG